MNHRLWGFLVYLLMISLRAKYYAINLVLGSDLYCGLQAFLSERVSHKNKRRVFCLHADVAFYAF